MGLFDNLRKPKSAGADAAAAGTSMLEEQPPPPAAGDAQSLGAFGDDAPGESAALTGAELNPLEQTAASLFDLGTPPMPKRRRQDAGGGEAAAELPDASPMPPSAMPPSAMPPAPMPPPPMPPAPASASTPAWMTTASAPTAATPGIGAAAPFGAAAEAAPPFEAAFPPMPESPATIDGDQAPAQSTNADAAAATLRPEPEVAPTKSTMGLAATLFGSAGRSRATPAPDSLPAPAASAQTPSSPTKATRPDGPSIPLPDLASLASTLPEVSGASPATPLAPPSFLDAAIPEQTAPETPVAHAANVAAATPVDLPTFEHSTPDPAGLVEGLPSESPFGQFAATAFEPSLADVAAPPAASSLEAFPLPDAVAPGTALPDVATVDSPLAEPEDVHTIAAQPEVAELEAAELDAAEFDAAEFEVAELHAGEPFAPTPIAVETEPIAEAVSEVSALRADPLATDAFGASSTNLTTPALDTSDPGLESPSTPGRYSITADDPLSFNSADHPLLAPPPAVDGVDETADDDATHNDATNDAATDNDATNHVATTPGEWPKKVSVGDVGLLAFFGLTADASIDEVSAAHAAYVEAHAAATDDSESEALRKRKCRREINTAYASFRLTHAA